MEIAEKIRAFMDEKKMSEAEFAAAVGVSRGALHNWLKGVGRPSANAAEKIEKYLSGDAEGSEAAENAAEGAAEAGEGQAE